MADAKITFTGDARQLLAEYEKLHKQMAKQDQSLMRLKKSTNDVAESSRKMTAGTKAALAEAETAAEKYQKTVAQLQGQLAAGTITEEKFSRARKAAQATFKATDPASIAKAAEATKARAAAMREADDAQQSWNDAVREASQIADKFSTVEEQHAAELQKYNALRALGVLQEKDYARAVAASDARLKEATKDTKALAEAERAENKLQQEAIAITNANKTAKERYTENVRLAEKALGSGKITLETFNRELARQKRILDEATPSGITFTGVLKGIGAAAAVAATGIAALILEEQKLADLKKKAADENVPYGEVLATTVNNFSEDKTLKADQLDDEFAKIQDRHKVRDRKAIARVAGEAFSAKGDLTNEEALKFVDSAFMYSPNDEATANTFATRSLDLAKATGVKDPKQVQGFMSQVQKAARVADITALGNEGVQAMLAANTFGATPEQSGELFATMNSLLTDVRGANSKTATVALSSQLMDEKLIKKAGLTKAFAGKGLMDRIGLMQRTPGMAKKFMDAEGVSFEGASAPFIHKFLSGEEKAMAEYRSVQAAVPELGPEAAREFEKLISERNALPQVKLAIEDRAREATNQTKELKEGQTRGREGIADKTFDDTLQGVDLPGPDKGMDIPGVTALTGGYVRIPGMESFVRAQAWMNERVFGQDRAQAQAGALKSATGFTMNEGDVKYSNDQQANLLQQSIQIQQQTLKVQQDQLAEQRRLADEQRAAIPAPQPKPDPLVWGPPQ